MITLKDFFNDLKNEVEKELLKDGIKIKLHEKVNYTTCKSFYFYDMKDKFYKVLPAVWYYPSKGEKDFYLIVGKYKLYFPRTKKDKNYYTILTLLKNNLVLDVLIYFKSKNQ